MTQAALPQPGAIVGSKYRVQRLLGQGGMGMVFEVSHVVTDKRFAIKWLLTDPTHNDEATGRFVREAQVAGRCDHRHIVEVYDIDREHGSLYMVMELLKGVSLAERLVQGGRMHYREACRLLTPCVEAIHEVHAAGIVHRDIKPANLFVCEARGREPELAKVLDFGVSRFTAATLGAHNIADAKTKDGAVIGTPYYMAPEQMRGETANVRTDVYSMGVTLYETLAGVRPYDAVTYGDLLLKVAQGNPPPLSTLAPDVPRGLVEVVHRALSRSEARYADMEQLAKALEPYAAHKPSRRSALSVLTPSSGERSAVTDTPWVTEATPTLQGEPPPSSAKARSWWPAAAILVLIAAGGAAFAWWPRDAAQAHKQSDVAAAGGGMPIPVPPPTAAAPVVEAATQPTAAEPAAIQAVPVVEPARTPTPTRRAERRAKREEQPAATPSAKPRAKGRAPATMEREDF